MVVRSSWVLDRRWVGWWYISTQINPEGESGDRRQLHRARRRDGRVARAPARGRGPDRATPAVFRWYVERNGGLELDARLLPAPPRDHMGNMMARLRTPPARRTRGSRSRRASRSRRWPTGWPSEQPPADRGRLRRRRRLADRRTPPTARRGRHRSRGCSSPTPTRCRTARPRPR